MEKEKGEIMDKYEIIIFDLDDTLIDNLENIRYAYKKTLEYLGEEYTEESFIRWNEFDKQFWLDRASGKIIIPEEYKNPKEKMIEYVRSLRYFLYFDGKITLEQAFEINKIYIDSLNEKIIPIEGSYETLKYLHSKYKLVIATNGPSLVVKSKLSKIECLELVDYIFSADLTYQLVSKPKKEYFEELFEYINYNNKEKMLMIGDSIYSDIQGGINAGIDTCWYNRNNQENNSIYQPTIMITKLKELTKIL